MLKIPFGFDLETNEVVDASAVSNGLKCNCVCLKCSGLLQAVHPKKRRPYFRHHKQKQCKASLESIFHEAAKLIIMKSKYIYLADGRMFHYNNYRVETPLYRKTRPDVYISNQDENWVVEIKYTHGIENTTLAELLRNNEQVIEIDISQCKGTIFNYQELKNLVLETAPRKHLTLHSLVARNAFPESSPSRPSIYFQWERLDWMRIISFVLMIIFFGILIYGISGQKRKKNKKRFYAAT